LLLSAVAACDSGEAGIIDERQDGALASAGVRELFRRDARNDGVNALFMFCAVHEHPVPFDPGLVRDCIARFGRPTTLLDIRNCARELGLPAEVLAPTPGRLAELGTPLIAHLDDDRGNRGRFVLLCSISSEHVDYVNAGYATWTRQSRETFLRAWSGYVLAPTASLRVGGGLRHAGLVASAVAALYIGARLAWRRFPHRRMAERSLAGAKLSGEPPSRVHRNWLRERP
jgi:hypothetical protein